VLQRVEASTYNIDLIHGPGMLASLLVPDDRMTHQFIIAEILA